MVFEFLKNVMNDKRIILGFIAVLFVMMIFMTPKVTPKPQVRPLEKSEPLVQPGPGTYLNTYLHNPVLVDESRNQKIPQVGSGSVDECITDSVARCHKLPLWSAS